MNEENFRALLLQAPEEYWWAVVDGRGLLLVDDQRLEPGPLDAPNLIIRLAENTTADAVALMEDALANAEQLLADYYRTHPLTLTGFNHQAGVLIAEHGAMAFAALEGQLPERTLFVDGGELVAEAADSPRHRYGVFCELQRPLPAAAIEGQVKRWLARGDAHERYLGMNVCRYNC